MITLATLRRAGAALARRLAMAASGAGRAHDVALGLLAGGLMGAACAVAGIHIGRLLLALGAAA